MARNPKISPHLMVLRGSLIILKRRCGKPRCRCNDGPAHETPALSFSLQGKTGILTLREEDVPEVRAALARYAKAVAELEKQTRAGITSLRRHLEVRRKRGSARRQS